MDYNRLIVKPCLTRRREIIHINKAVAHATLHVPDSSRLIQTAKNNKEAQPIADRLAAQQQRANAVIVSNAAVVNKSSGLQNDQRRQQKIKKPIKYLTGDNTDLDRERLGNIRGYGAGRILVIVGNGPSLKEVPTDKLNNQPMIDLMSINHPDERIWPTRFWAFFDVSQAARHKALWERYDGLLFNSTAIKQRRPSTIQLKNLGASGFSRDLQRGFHIGQSSVYVAMQIALWMRFEHTYILGVDMCEVDGNLHYYGVNPDVNYVERKNRFVNEARYYQEAAKILTAEERNKFTFCSNYNVHPFVNEFCRLDQTVAAYEILDHARRLDVEARAKCKSQA